MATCLPEGDTLERTVDSHISKLRKKLEDPGVRAFRSAFAESATSFGVLNDC
jgi:hypothetical protein